MADVTTDAVRDFLQNSGAAPAPVKEQTVQVPNRVIDALSSLGGVKVGEEAPAPEPAPAQAEPPPIPPNPIYEGELKTVKRSLDWSMQVEKLGKVEVTPHERNLYLKAVVTDTPVIFPVTILNGTIRVVCRTARPHESNLAYWTACLDQKEGRIGPDEEQLCSRMQCYVSLLQVDQFNEEPYTRLEFPATEPIEDGVARLRKALDDVFPTRTWGRWNAMLTAVRKFERKIQICNINLPNEDFWNPAGAD